MFVNVIIVIEYGILKKCFALSDDEMAQKHYDQLRQEHSGIFVFKTKCKLDDVMQMNLGI